MKRSLQIDEDDPVKTKRSHAYSLDGRLSCDSDHVKRNTSNKMSLAKDDPPINSLDKVNLMEQMEIENYSLRKRCKRLESIVTQLLETKGKTGKDHGSNEEKNEKRLPQHDELPVSPLRDKMRFKNRSSIHSIENLEVSLPLHPRYLDSVLHVPKPHLSPPNKLSNKLSPGTYYGNGELSPVPKYGNDALSTAEKQSRTEYKGTVDDLLKKQRISPKNTVVFGEETTDRESRSSPTLKKDLNEGKNVTKEGDKHVSVEEMEKRNELFRATYYVHKQKPRQMKRSLTPEKVQSEKRIYNQIPLQNRSPPLSDLGTISTYRVSERSGSPTLVVTPFYRSPAYVYSSINSDKERIERDENYRPELLRIATQPHREAREPHRKYYEPLSYPNLSLKPTHFDSHVRSRVSPPTKEKPLPLMGPEIPIRAPVDYYAAISRSNRLAMSQDPDFNKYDGDFYRKLPPKLHIVESQNENGVTLTWNATSNCDSSLVKSYQLFSRELFGHKVGTMKRIGIVDALPLPMSCSVDKLKYNIKYKFAVCAVDIYERFGKMSNFTGKFELKAKGPIKNEPEDESYELHIIA